MKFLRYIFLPFSILYGMITAIRNFLFDKGILKSYSFDIPIIAVGNLSVGGTGKTPQIEYLIRLLSTNYSIATLSRGYKRKSKGFVLANSNSNAEIIGDEPFQMYQKFPRITVAVDANRKNGIEQLLSLVNKPDVILLDDAYQHRKIKAGFYILLSSYDDLYYDDWMLPTGNLRENKNGAKRANMIIITKCPKNLSELAQENIKQKIGLTIPIFFSCIDYDDKVYNELESISLETILNKQKVLIAGIAKPEPFFNFLNAKKGEKLVYPDHHHFTSKNINEINEKAKDKLIISTEKDFVRLKNNDIASPLYYLPIKSKFITNQNNFDTTILDYVREN